MTQVTSLEEQPRTQPSATQHVLWREKRKNKLPEKVYVRDESEQNAYELQHGEDSAAAELGPRQLGTVLALLDIPIPTRFERRATPLPLALLNTNANLATAANLCVHVIEKVCDHICNDTQGAAAVISEVCLRMGPSRASTLMSFLPESPSSLSFRLTTPCE